MEITLSEYGKKFTNFDTIGEAISFCEKNGFTDGEEGALWFVGETRKETKKFIDENVDKFSYDYMHISYEVKSGQKWMWVPEFESAYNIGCEEGDYVVNVIWNEGRWVKKEIWHSDELFI